MVSFIEGLFHCIHSHILIIHVLIIIIITGFTDADNDRVFHLPLTTSIGGTEKTLTLSQIQERLLNVYCKSVGLEYMHINDRARCELICS